MGLPLIAFLILAPPAHFPPARGAQLVAALREPTSSVESSGAQRIRWARGRTVEDDLGRFWAQPGYPLGLVRAVEWVDSLPVKVDVRGGAVTLTLQLHGP